MTARPSLSITAFVSAGTLFLVPLSVPSPAQAISNTIVVGQVYTAGGEVGAVFQSDYVVLFNLSTETVDVSGWSLQVASSGPVGPTWDVVPLCGTIAHGRYYLVALGSGGTAGIPLPTADCSGSVNLDVEIGTIALVSNQVVLPDPCPLTNPSVVDLVGYGPTAQCSQGAPAASPGPTASLLRSPNPCNDLDANAVEFALTVPVPTTSADVDGCNNQPPTLDPIADQFMAEGDSIGFTAVGSDADGDPLTFIGTGPSWFSVDINGFCNLVPGYDAVGLGGGSEAATVTASDGITSVNTGFTIHVFNTTTATNMPYGAQTWTGVGVATGELSFVAGPDLCLGGPRSLCIRRYYASFLDREGVEGSFGTNWLGSYDWGYVETPTEVTVTDPRGRVYRFVSGVGGSWTLVEPQDAPYQLTELGPEMSFTHARHRVFYIVDRSQARLSRIEDGRGNVHTLSYVGNDLSTVSDGLGRTLTFGHDGMGRVTSVTDGTRTVLYTYTGSDLTSVTDAELKTTTYQYDLSHLVPGLLTAAVDASGGNALQYQYDAEGRVGQVQLGSASFMTRQQTMLSASEVATQVQWPDGGMHQYTHDPFGRLTQYIDPQSGVTTWAYDGQGRPMSFTRPSTIVPVTIGYDPVSGFPETLTLPDANTWQLAYVDRTFPQGQLFFLSSIQAPDLGQVTYLHDGVGNLTQITDQASNGWTMTHNAFGQPLTITSPTSGVITNTYDTSGRLQTSNDGAGTTQFAYDPQDRLITLTNPDASTRTFTWNGRNQLLTATNELSKTWTYAYRDNGQLLSVTDPLLATTTLSYDSRRRPEQITDALSGVTTIAYDPTWRISSVTDPTLRTVSFQYDLLGRRTGVTDPGSQTTTYGYDVDSRLTSITNPLTHTWSYGYNSRDQLTSVTDPLLNATTYGHDPVGRVTTVNRPLGLNTTYTYDLRGLVTSATTGPVSVGFTYNSLWQLDTFTDAESHAWTRTYDPMGRIASKTDPLLHTITYSYDNRNRRTGITHPEGTVTLIYNTASQLTQRSHSDGTVYHYTYDDVGRMLTTEGMTRAYDDLGRVIEENGVTYTYDAGGMTETETLSAGHEIGHSYGLRGLPSQTTDWLSGVTTYTFDAAGRLTGLDRPNGTSARYDYDDAGRLLELREVTASDTIGMVQLTRDALGRVTSVDRSMPLPWPPETTSRTYAYDASSQVVGFTYDNLRRLLDDGVRTYAWDGASRADSINEGPTTTRYTSDGLDRVMSVQKAGGPEFMVVAPAAIAIFGHKVTDLMAAAGSMLPGAHEEDNSPIESGKLVETTQDERPAELPLSHPIKIVREVTTPGGMAIDRMHWVTAPGGVPLHRIDLSGGTLTRRYYHFDEAGNTAFLTNDGGSVVTSYVYSPTGERDALGEGQPYPALTYKGRFGVVEEAPSGLYRIGPSFYDAQTTSDLPVNGSMILATPPEDAGALSIRQTSGMLLGIRTVDSHPQEVLDLVAAATGDVTRVMGVDPAPAAASRPLGTPTIIPQFPAPAGAAFPPPPDPEDDGGIHIARHTLRQHFVHDPLPDEASFEDDGDDESTPNNPPFLEPVGLFHLEDAWPVTNQYTAVFFGSYSGYWHRYRSASSTSSSPGISLAKYGGGETMVRASFVIEGEY